MIRLVSLALAIFGSLGIGSLAEADDPPAAAAKPDFASVVKPIFEKRCVSCHGPKRQRGGLRLDLRADALQGGDSGPVIVAGRSEESLLFRYVAGLEDDVIMPPEGEGERLSADQVAALRAWIDQGAVWPDSAAGNAEPSETWWSLRPLVRPPLPRLAEPDQRWVRNPVDAFIIDELRRKGLAPSPEADRRTLFRRLHFDLIGLPPNPDEADAFVNDPDPRAYEALVDRLLASPRYGERWARHWLDVVHYGETHGYDKDKPRPNAWPYRDYVIRSFNQDKPYGRFIQEQIAGDALFPGTADGIEALGFIAAGPWDFIGHAEVPETKIDGKIARHLDRDDMVANAIGTFNSLTVHCAQCHHHKFDPIPQDDYYALQAVFAAVDRTERAYDPDPNVAARRAALQERKRDFTQRQTELADRIRQRGGPALADLDRRIAEAAKPRSGQTPKTSAAFGWHSGIAATPDVVKWVQADLKRPASLRSVVLHPCEDDFNGIGKGFGFPVRFKVEASDDPEFRRDVRLLADRTGGDFANPGIAPIAFDVPDDAQPARYLRVTAIKLALRSNDYIFALAELSVRDKDGANVARGAVVTSGDSIEAPPRWGKANLVDGWHPGVGTGDEAELIRLQRDRERLAEATATPEESRRKAEWDAELTKVSSELAKLPPQRMTFAGGVHYGSGAFRGTGSDNGRPRKIRVLARGDVQKPGKEATPGALSCVPGLPSRFELPADHDERERRAALARWLASEKNILTWRSIVNRVWLYHFGRGIVDTPNDFGKMGMRPSHPALLDWLAVELRDGGQSLKAIHRLLATSATYRQSSAVRPEAAAIDSENALRWRMNRRLLEAEAIRDSILSVSGKLDLTMGGPSFQDFVIEKPEHSPHYQYHLHDPDDPRSHRRSIYRFIVRSQQQPFLSALDCADPSMAVDKRNQTITPLQALTLLNHQLTASMAKHFAARAETLGQTLDDRAAAAFRQALARPPSADERAAIVAYAAKHGLPNLCRMLLNLNEFAFAD